MKKTVCVLLAFAVTLALMGGCGTPPSTVNPDASADPAASGAAATTGEEIVFRVGGVTTDTLNPLTTYVAGSMEMIMLMYEPLVRSDENHEPIPGLAESWEVSDDELTWTFHLVKGAKWHDGETVTSEDVKYTYDLMNQTGLGYAYAANLYGIETIECPDENTVVMTTATPKANMLLHATPILPKHIWSAIPEENLEQELNANPIGCGPFKFGSKTDSNDQFKLVRNEDYFGQKSNIDSIVFIEYANEDSMTQSLKLGEIDGFFQSSADQMAAMEGDANIDALSAKLPGFSQIGINVYEEGTGNPILRDVNVRYAMEYALDRQKIKDMVFFGCAELGSTLMSAVGGWHYEVPANELRSYNIDKANALLDEAGYKDTNGDGVREAADGSPLEFTILYNPEVVTRTKTASFLQSGCSEIGIKINSTPMDGNAIADAIAEYSYDMFIWGWYEELDPTTMLNILTTDELFMNNEPGWSNERYDELFMQQQEELDHDTRLALIQEMQKIIYDDCPYIIVAYDEEIQAIRKDKWTGYKSIPEGGPFFINNTIVNYLNLKPVQ